MKFTKKLISFVVAVIMIFSVFTVVASAEDFGSIEENEYNCYDATWVLVGSEGLTGYDWESDPEIAYDNVMSLNMGFYSIRLTDIPAYEVYEFMMVANYPDGTQEWYGDENGEPVSVYIRPNTYSDNGMLTGELTISFNPSNKYDHELNVNDDTGSYESPVITNKNKVYGIHQTETGFDYINLKWADVKTAKKYWVYIDGKVVASTTESAYKLTNLDADSTYSVSITALLENGKMFKLDDADYVDVYTKGVYPYAEADVDSINIYLFDDVEKAWIYYGTDENNLDKRVSTTGYLYTLKNLSSNTTYYYKVVYYVDGKCIESAVESVVTQSKDELFVEAYEENGEYTLYWAECNESYKYWVYIETEDKTYIYSTTETSFVVPDLGYDYYKITVKGLNAEDGTYSYYPVEISA